MEFKQLLRQEVLFLDGGMGTTIHGLGLEDGHFGGPDYKMLVDLLSFSQPEAMIGVHLQFYRAGAHAVETNTFGSSPFRLAEYDFSGLNLERFAPNPYGKDPRLLSHEDFAYYLSRRGAELACAARDRYRAEPGHDGRPLFVIGSMGPSNRVLSSTRATLRQSTFAAIADNFRRQALGLIDGGVDVLLYETQQDILELKAAVFGGRQAMVERGVSLPIMAQVTVDQFSRMQIFNTHIHAAQVTLQGIGIDVFGINCSIGPDLMIKSVETLSRFSPLPVSVVPNAGLPVSENGQTVFRFEPDRFSSLLRDFVAEYGVQVVGGCCGTTPDHIAATVDAIRGLAPRKRAPERGLYVSGPQEAVLLDSSRSLIRFGERLNARGSKKVRDAVENDTGINHDVLEEVVREQVQGLGCEVVDVCMDSNVVDTVAVLREVVHIQTTDFSGAMCLDSFQVDALAEAVKVYPGRPIINSISMEEASPGVLKIDAVIEATAGHDPLFVALCTGPKGPAATAREKLDLATEIIGRARDRHGVAADRIFVDVNVFPIGSESVEGMNFAVESLEGVRLVKERFPETHTSLGVGNLTNGLAKKPYMRIVLTSVFLDEARKRGLDAAIINPSHYVFVSDLDPAHYRLGLRVVLERDMDAFAELEGIAAQKAGGEAPRRVIYDDLPVEEAVIQKIKDGHKERQPGSFTFRKRGYDYQDRIVLQVADAMERHAPLDFINTHLMRAMQDLGDGFGRGEVSLPHLLKSADVMRQAMGFLEKYMRDEAGVDVHAKIDYKGTVVIGTVYQDVHSIGKDLARTLLENYGYRVIDLGTMTPLQAFIDAAREHHADAIGMSALLVQTSNHMITVARMMAEQGLDLPVLIGGAPVSDRHAAFVAMAGGDDTARMRGDVFYCRTAMDGVNVMNAIRTTDPARKAELLESNRKKLIHRYEHALQRAAREEELFATLPRRVISHDEIALPAEPRFRARRVEYDLRDFAAHIDRKTLYALNWKFGGSASRERTHTTAAELGALFNEWVDKAARHGWLKPQGVMGLFPCWSEGEEVVVLDPGDASREVARLTFTTVIGAGSDDLLSGAQFFTPRGAASEPGVIGLQITTSGPQVDAFIEKMKAEGDSESALFLQGLSDRIAEDMADHLNALQRELLGIGPKAGLRWSPGYPGMRDIQMNRVIMETLGAGPAIGVIITPAGEFSPTGTTAAAVSFHPGARYS
jgi:5-methyltetrahydrofolate--homocysteine methyltransferase